jgi:chromosome segregation ATPase
MVDKSHTVTDPEEVEREYRALKAVNEKETKKIDVIITERSEIERRARDIDTSIKKHQDAVQQKMDELPEEKRDQWFALQEEDRQLTTEISGLQSQVEEVRNQVLNEEDALLRDPLKKQALDLTRAVAEKEQEAEELKKATAHLRLSFPEQKKLLLDQVKRDNEDMRKIEDEMKLLKEEVNAGRDRLHEMDTDLAENQGGGQEDNQKKMMDFYEKMQQELGNFAEVKSTEEADIEAAQTKTVDLLEYISRLERAVVNMPTQQQAADMQDELKFKQQQMEQSQQTVDKMEQELLKVKDEADKLAGIDQKIETEMSQLSQRKEEMMQEMEVYRDMAKLEMDCETKKQVSQLECACVRTDRRTDRHCLAECRCVRACVCVQSLDSTKKRLLKQLETLGAQLQSAKTEHEAQQAFLKSDETHSQLNALVKKLGSQEQTVYQLQECTLTADTKSTPRRATSPVCKSLLPLAGVSLCGMFMTVADSVCVCVCVHRCQFARGGQRLPPNEAECADDVEGPERRVCQRTQAALSVYQSLDRGVCMCSWECIK